MVCILLKQQMSPCFLHRCPKESHITFGWCNITTQSYVLFTGCSSSAYSLKVIWGNIRLGIPVQLLQRNRDLQIVSQHVKGCDDVGPLNHLTQRASLQHLGTEDIPGFLRQKAHVDENLSTEGKREKSRREKRAEERSEPQHTLFR